MQNVDVRNDNIKTVAFMTLGCKVNYYETEKMTSQFIEAGYEVVGFTEKAALYVINTCTVTNIADRKSRKMIHRAKKLNPMAIVAAVGCYAQAAKEVLEADDSIDLVIGNDRKDQMLAIVEEFLGQGWETIVPVNNSDVLSQERTRAYIKIQDGCNQFCSYCIIPYVRGKLTSRSKESIVQEVKGLVEEGYKELVITGIHLSSYGVDLTQEKSFVALQGKPLLELLEVLGESEGLERIRLGSLEPRIITEEFVQALARNAKVCPHFHLSLQSGCNSTLQRMNRKYTPEDYENACQIIRKYFDEPAITTDVIVGFPGETVEEFNETKCFLEKISFAQMHIFKYSIRTGTKAEQMDGQVSEVEKARRSNELLLLERTLFRKYCQKFIGCIQNVLVEEKHEIDGETYWVGHNKRYIRLAIPTTSISGIVINKVIEVTLVEMLNEETIFCKPLKK